MRGSVEQRAWVDGLQGLSLIGSVQLSEISPLKSRMQSADSVLQIPLIGHSHSFSHPSLPDDAPVEE